MKKIMNPKKEENYGAAHASPPAERYPDDQTESEMFELWLKRGIHFFEFCTFSEELTYQFLCFQERLLALADDVARVATFGFGLKSQIKYSAVEIIGTLDIREIIEVPGPEIPANFEGAVQGTYIPLEMLSSMLYGGKFADDSSFFSHLLNRFEEHKTWRLEEMLRGERLRKARLKQAEINGGRLRCKKIHEEKFRKAELQVAKLRETKLWLEKW